MQRTLLTPALAAATLDTACSPPCRVAAVGAGVGVREVGAKGLRLASPQERKYQRYNRDHPFPPGTLPPSRGYTQICLPKISLPLPYLCFTGAYAASDAAAVGAAEAAAAGESAATTSGGTAAAVAGGGYNSRYCPWQCRGPPGPRGELLWPAGSKVMDRWCRLLAQSS